MAYVLVDDIKAATAKARELGANVMKDSVEVMGAGFFSIITDPTGAMLGLWQVNKG
jgi:predicted enzyme related to lactoylglutathione lyase